MDVVFQGVHQSHAHRLVLYHRRRGVLPIFPKDGFGEEAVELGPRTNKSGPCLTLLSNVTVTKAEFLQWFKDSYLKTSRYVLRIYFFDRERPPAATWEDVVKKLTEMGAPKSASRLQCYPRKREGWLGTQLSEDFVLDPRSFGQVISAVEADGQVWYSVTPADSLFLNSAVEPCRFGDENTKAHSKLEEALIVAGTSLEGRRGWCAVDLGAAPGGWTSIMAEQVKLVIAIDPAELFDFAKKPNVIHLRRKSEDCIEEVKRLSEPTQGVDLLVCDMNMHPQRMAEIVKTMLPLLKSGALLVLTFKFFGVGRDRTDNLATVLKLIGPGIHGGECVWLLANTVHERCLIAWRD